MTRSAALPTALAGAAGAVGNPGAAEPEFAGNPRGGAGRAARSRSTVTGRISPTPDDGFCPLTGVRRISAPVPERSPEAAELDVSADETPTGEPTTGDPGRTGAPAGTPGAPIDGPDATDRRIGVPAHGSDPD